MPMTGDREGRGGEGREGRGSRGDPCWSSCCSPGKPARRKEESPAGALVVLLVVDPAVGALLRAPKVVPVARWLVRKGR